MDPNTSPVTKVSEPTSLSIVTSSPTLVDSDPRMRRLYDPSSSPPRNGFRETYRNRLFPTPSPPDSPVFVATAGEVSLSPTPSEVSDTVSDHKTDPPAVASLRKLALRGSSQRATKPDEDFDEISDMGLVDSNEMEPENSINDDFFDAPEHLSTADGEEPQPEYFDIHDEEEPTSDEGPLTEEQRGLLAGALRENRSYEGFRMRCRRMHDRLYRQYQNLDFGIHPRQGVYTRRLGRWRRRR
ncbi:hypothetical protein MMC18_002788 [Xylographa bjoerkii]|nr:hypothetical protein [Xylographa bjoerkii]